MDTNVPKITESNLPDDNYFIVRMCVHCQDIKEEMATPFPMPFPSVRLAKAMMQGMIEDAIEEDPSVKIIDGVVHRTDEDGEKHQYVQAVIHITNKIVWRPGDDEQIDSKFNDIIGAFDLDTPTE
jgi:hypothetical protein